ncbi:MAG: energy transducer TonB, partial [Chthoniobacterales bacterium]
VSAKPAPKKSDFESDRDTVAASQLPAESDRQVPTTNGENTPGLTLTAQNLSLGPARQPSSPSPASPAKPAQPVEKPKAKPEPTPPDKQIAKATPTPKPTPRPEDSELAMLDPSRPKPQPPAEQPKPTPEQQMPPSRPQPPGFQPQTRITKLTGGISNRGKASIGADASPLGKYKKQVSDAIGSRWYYYVSDMIDLVNVGAVQLNFIVRKDGTIEGVRVVRNSSNESLASCSVRAIIEAEIPPMPKEVANAVAGGKIEVDFTFSVIR